jgi:hypothetical protein
MTKMKRKRTRTAPGNRAKKARSRPGRISRRLGDDLMTYDPRTDQMIGGSWGPTDGMWSTAIRVVSQHPRPEGASR